MSSEENKAVIRRFYEEFHGQRNDGVAREIIVDDFVVDNPPSRDRETFLRGVAELRAAFPDLLVTHHHLTAEGDRVVARWTLQGTHRGALRGIAPTRRKVAVTGMTIFRLAGGRIVEAWNNYGPPDLWEQLGTRPPAPAGRATSPDIGQVEDELIRLQNEWMDALQRRDLDALETILAPDFTLTSVTTDDLIDRAEWLRAALDRVVNKDFRYEGFHIQMYGDAAVVKSRFHQTATIDGKDWDGDFLITDVWIRRKGRWQVVARHSSRPSGRSTAGRMGESR